MSGGEERAGAAARLRADVEVAGRMLSPVWPIETFIAVNPLGGLEDRPFADAVEFAGTVLGARGVLPEDRFRDAYRLGRIADGDLMAAMRRRGLGAVVRRVLAMGSLELTGFELLLRDLLDGEPAPRPRRTLLTAAESDAPQTAQEIDEHCSKWCAAFLDEGQAGWPMPGREHGFYEAWRRLAPLERSLPQPARRQLRELPGAPESAVLEGLARLGVGADRRMDYLRAHLSRQPGWAAHIRWRAEHVGDMDLVGYLAMRISYEAALVPGAHRPDLAAPSPQHRGAYERALHVARGMGVGGETTIAQLVSAAEVLEAVPVRERELLWLEAYEGHYRDSLLASIDPPSAPSGGRPAAQLVCCIDARSEGLRRNLEAEGRYETLGFAGFFAVAIRYRDLAGGESSDLCPVLLRPRNEVCERPTPGSERVAERRLAGIQAFAGAQQGLHSAKDELLSPFALADAGGWAAGPVAAMKTIAPGRFGTLRERARLAAVPEAPTVLGVQRAFSFDERARFAHLTLTMMGLTDRFAPIVVLCGHGSTSENNPYAASLDCGACGGHRGGPNARVAAAILNGQDVRDHLRSLGIVIPPDTWFVPAEHDTATDEVTLLDSRLVPQELSRELSELQAALGRAGERLSAERCAGLPGAPESPTPARAARHVRSRSSDWSQVFAEWGLAGNAAFIVGPRSMTAGVDLGRRVFLHSYEAAVDTDGSALETILTAPLVVAQWISCQYYFSTVDPGVFGSGTKTIHNVVGGLGVLSGQGGDLRTGLPWQSVAVGDRLVHEPMRLLAAVQAPLSRIDELIARNTVLQRLFGNGWVALAARADGDREWHRRTTRGWEPWTEREVGRT